MKPKASLDPATQQPVGPLVDATSAEAPKAVVLQARVRPCDPLVRRAPPLFLWLSCNNHILCVIQLKQLPLPVTSCTLPNMEDVKTDISHHRTEF